MPAAGLTRGFHIWLVTIGIAVGTLAISGQVRQFQFVSWDDNVYVYENPHIAHGLTTRSVAWAFSSGYASNWHPVTWISHLVDVELFGLKRGQDARVFPGAVGHHLVSAAWHAVNSMLLLLAFYRMTGAFWPSAMTAALFAVHPLQVESVAWISERKDVLSGFFFMLTLLAYQRYVQDRTLGRYLLVLTALALGLMAKPMLVTMPFLLLLIDVWPLRRCEWPGWAPRRIVMEKMPMLGLVVASCLITVFVQHASGAVASLDKIPWAWRVVNTPLAYVTYLFKMIWSTNLACFCPHPASLPMERLRDWIIPAIAATMFLVVVTVVVLRLAPKTPYLAGMLVPVIGLS